MNPPLASHIGGVWERQIRSARNILSSLMKTHGASLDEESLNTLFVEVESIVNSRPLVVKTINDVNSRAALSPSHILTMKSKAVIPPPHLACLGHPTLIAKRDGGGYSTSVTSFGVVGEKNFLLVFKTGRNGKHH